MNLGLKVSRLIREYKDINVREVFADLNDIQDEYRAKHGKYYCEQGLRKQEDHAYETIKERLKQGYYVRMRAI